MFDCQDGLSISNDPIVIIHGWIRTTSAGMKSVFILAATVRPYDKDIKVLDRGSIYLVICSYLLLGMNEMVILICYKRFHFRIFVFPIIAEP